MTELAAKFYLGWGDRVTSACYALFTVVAYGNDATELRKVVVYGCSAQARNCCSGGSSCLPGGRRPRLGTPGPSSDISLRNCIEFSLYERYVFGRMA